MEVKPLLEVEKLALKKYKIYQTSVLHYVLRAALASMFIGFGVIVAFKSGGYFYNVHSPAAYPMAAFTFGAAIILIAYGGGDLFTGNTFYYTFAALRKKMKWSIVVRLWTLSYTGNIIGAVVFALLIYTTQLFSDASVNQFLLSVVEHKMTAPTLELFFRGILCNWLVCLAFFIPMTLKGDGAKLFVMVLFVFCFFISGYEHSIANMCTFAIAMVLDHPGTISFAGIIHNLVPVTIGNLIGGSLLMGWMYYYVNKPYLDEEDQAG
ncbi:formate/nitrite transporter family protein [Cytobacillus gottheilii]|uniref:formate/nitrite transporter family protein n=1 Tax=Cytobacillus gottheilii TaxID=859144 RepID=UPI0009BB24C2|nr:formate/nitrite transporter family protein [Cytobacillus gottheilii]